jgi:hypothetical protein
VASVLRLSGPEAFSHVAVAFSLSAAACSLMPTRVGKLLKAAAEVSVPEIIPGLTTIMRCLTKFMIRPAEVMEGFTEATTMVVAVVTVAMVAIVAATFVPAVVLVEQTAQLLSDHHSEGTSEHTSGDSSEDTSEPTISISRHSVFSIVARGCPRLLDADARVPVTGRLRQKQIRPSVICRTSDPSQLCRKLGCSTHAEAMESCPSREQHAIEGAIAFDDVD